MRETSRKLRYKVECLLNTKKMMVALQCYCGSMYCSIWSSPLLEFQSSCYTPSSHAVATRVRNSRMMIKETNLSFKKESSHLIISNTNLDKLVEISMIILLDVKRSNSIATWQLSESKLKDKELKPWQWEPKTFQFCSNRNKKYARRSKFSGVSQSSAMIAQSA